MSCDPAGSVAFSSRARSLASSSPAVSITSAGPLACCRVEGRVGRRLDLDRSCCDRACLVAFRSLGCELCPGGRLPATEATRSSFCPLGELTATGGLRPAAPCWPVLRAAVNRRSHSGLRPAVPCGPVLRAAVNRRSHISPAARLSSAANTRTTISLSAVPDATGIAGAVGRP